MLFLSWNVAIFIIIRFTVNCERDVSCCILLSNRIAFISASSLLSPGFHFLILSLGSSRPTAGYNPHSRVWPVYAQFSLKHSKNIVVNGNRQILCRVPFIETVSRLVSRENFRVDLRLEFWVHQNMAANNFSRLSYGVILATWKKKNKKTLNLSKAENDYFIRSKTLSA